MTQEIAEQTEEFAPDPYANPDTGAGGTLAWEQLPVADKKRISRLLVNFEAGNRTPRNKNLLEKYRNYFPAMVRSMDDPSIINLILDNIGADLI